VIYKSSVAALQAYHVDDFDRALHLSRDVLQQNAHDAEAHLCIALVLLRRGTATQAIPHLRNCAALRSGDWLLERLRVELLERERFVLGKQDMVALGAFLRSILSPLSLPLQKDRRRADHDYVNVVGTSFVRSFGGNKAFFPLFIGMGPTMLLLNDEVASVTRRKFAENLKRVDPRRDTVLVLGGDCYYHVQNILKSRTGSEPDATPHDFAVIDAVAERHRPILADSQKLITGRVMLLCTTPTQNDLMNVLSLHLNRRLKEICDELGVEFLDWWNDLADPQTNRLADAHCANAYPGDIHFTLETTQVFMQRLKDLGSFGEAVTPRANFQWSHVFECEIDRAERTRLWSEPSVTPNNAFKSQKIAASHVGGKAADILVVLLAMRPRGPVAMINVREAYMPISVPPQVHSGIVALTDSVDNMHVGQMVIDFYGRTDIMLRQFDPQLLKDLSDVQFGCLVAIIHPGSWDADVARINQTLERFPNRCPVVLMTPSIERANEIAFAGYEGAVAIPLGNRHIPEEWREYSLAVALPKT
jgi:hypothetical protein